MTLGKNGMYTNVGIPGTGIYMREKVSGKTSAQPDTCIVAANDTGTYDLQAEVNNANKSIDDIINIAQKTPAIDDLITYPKRIFPEAPPIFHASKSAKWYPVMWGIIFFFVGSLAGPFGAIFGSGLAAWYSRKMIVSKETEKFNNDEIAKWQSRKADFDKEQDKMRKEFEECLSCADEAPEEALKAVLNIIDWPWETNVSFEIDGDKAMLDVDLPEIEDMPKEIFTLRGRGSKKTITEELKSEAQQRRDYSKHIHGIGMLLCGIVFNALDKINSVVISAYTQRLSNATGHNVDDYLYSVRINRADWEKVNLDNIEYLDPVEVLGEFEIRRNMTKTGIFKAIEPFGNE